MTYISINDSLYTICLKNEETYKELLHYYEVKTKTDDNIIKLYKTSLDKCHTFVDEADSLFKAQTSILEATIKERNFEKNLRKICLFGNFLLILVLIII